MTKLPSIRALTPRLTLVALLLTLTVLLVGCQPGLHHVRKGLTTDPSWQETQQAQSKYKNSKIKEYIIINYRQIMEDLAKGEGEYLNALVSMLKIEESNRSVSIKKIKSLSEVYTIIPYFAEHVANYFLK